MAAGIIGGLLGLGGGVILTPAWIGMGINSIRAPTSSTFTVLFTSFTSFFITLTGGNYTVV